ncbi:uncharacterized protein F4822DRAFT_29718 [Hypoxylon trugodes]|uniref:uncharacterized protein n=1 Tax=Hypoxylon trugodes TaxID=326681 RepID=UPI0021A02D09|nr:uncharacterized protein F4822DRAFT_29718 [Hypoxylon trugodes]KAI1393915.1 hypothetical protein F4822DRAFT_29718 [Hypoxylon trugodes]
MDSTPQAAQSPAASPAKGKAPAPKKTSGKGVTKKTSKKPAPKKGVAKKGPKKVYNDSFTQAAYERQVELKELYKQVAMAVRPALDEIADRNVKKLTEDLGAHKQVPEYDVLQDQLDNQLKQVIEDAEKHHDLRVRILEHGYELENDRIAKCFMDSFNYETEEFYDGALNRTSIVTELRREGHPLDTPDLTYSYVREIPHVSFLGPSDKPGTPINRKAKPTTKRKTEDQPDGQAASKKPRRTGGLLASEMQPDGVSESNAPSPTPAEEQESAPGFSKHIPDLPSGASDPDAYGVRSVNRRVKEPNNRFIIPPLFSWDDKEIGFRDSTNDSTRLATGRSRGIFIDTPNSSTWHIDHTVKDYDSRGFNDDTLDPEIVKKHGLHPKLGIFLPTSTNESEPPDGRVDGTRPVVVVPDAITTHHASRTVRSMKMDLMLKEDRIKNAMSEMLGDFCEKGDIDPEDITNDEIRDREREAVERQAAPSDESVDHVKSEQASLTEAHNSFLHERVDLLLLAAASSEAEVSSLPAPGPRPSRPYDAVRDVFTNAEPAPMHPELQHIEPDVFKLNLLAQAAERAPRLLEKKVPVMNDSSMIDPRLLGTQPPAPPNAFLQTALNPSSTFTNIAPAPVAQMETTQQTTPARNPFTTRNNVVTNTIAADGFLPPLRPNRSDGLGKGPNLAQAQQSPLPLTHHPQDLGSPHGPIRTNSGSFFPPAPSRPYHQGFSFHDQGLMAMSMQQSPHIPGPGMMPNQPPLPHHMSAYPPVMSPPVPGQSYLASVPPHIEPPAPSVSPPGPSMMTPSSPVHTPRQRNSVSSNGNGSGKYRRIAAAPVPHNRPWQSNGGSELRLAHYDHKEAIKDYRANEPPPRTGPTTIRGWNVNNVSKGRNRGVKKEDSEEKESPNMISPYIGKWNASV